MSSYYDLLYSSKLSTLTKIGNHVILDNKDTGKFIQAEATVEGPYSITIDINDIKKGYYWNVYMFQPISGSLTTVGTIYLSSNNLLIHMNIYISYGNGLTSASVFEDVINMPNYIISEAPTNYPIPNSPSRISPLSYPLSPPYTIGSSLFTPRPYGIKLKLICSDIIDNRVYMTADINYYTNPFNI